MKSVQRREVVRKRRGAPTKPTLQKTALVDAAFDHVRLATQTYLSVRETAAYLRLSSIWAVYRWANENAVPRCHVGRGIRFMRRDVDQVVQKSRQIDSEPSANRANRVHTREGTAGALR